jgi:hypothetical protein
MPGKIEMCRIVPPDVASARYGITGDIPDGFPSVRPGQSTNAVWPGLTGGFFNAAVSEMLRRGFTPGEIGKIAGRNSCRVFGKVTTARA